jgi:hypothetical protein
MGFGIGRLGAGLGRLGAGRGSARTARILLSGSTIVENSALGTAVGTLSVVNATGTPAFTLTDSSGNSFALDGDVIEVGATGVNYELATFHVITVSVADVTPTIADTSFTILVTDVFDDGGSPAMQFNSGANSQLIAVLDDF